MIRPTEPGDTPTLIEQARETGVFKPLEIIALREVLDDYHATNRSIGHVCVTYEDQARIQGFAYYAPAAMTDRTWYLWWIVVEKGSQGRGVGKQLMGHVEEAIEAKRGRLCLVETSSTPQYEPTRRFYLNLGYAEATRLVDFYADGDDLCVFAKRFPRGRGGST